MKGQKPYEEGENSGDYNAGLPVVAFTLSDDFKKDYPHVKQDSVSNLLRAKQYIIPSECPRSVRNAIADSWRLSASAKRGQDGDSARGGPRDALARHDRPTDY